MAKTIWVEHYLFVKRPQELPVTAAVAAATIAAAVAAAVATTAAAVATTAAVARNVYRETSRKFIKRNRRKSVTLFCMRIGIKVRV